jgi:hypothetical protein
MTAPLCSSQVHVNINICINIWHNYFEKNWPTPKTVFRWTLNKIINQYTVNTLNFEDWVVNNNRLKVIKTLLLSEKD